MAGTFSLNLTEARGAVAPPANLDATAVVMGVASGGTGISPFYLSAQSAVAALGYGDAVDTLCQMIEQRMPDGSGVKRPVAFYGTGDTTSGYYGTIDVTAVSGLATIAIDAASLPRGTYEAALKIITGGIVGVAGIVFQWSLDHGRTWSRYLALGTAATYTIPNSNAKFDFSPTSSNLTSLNTLLNEIKTDINAHFVLTTGTVHTNADTADVISTANATNTATRIALANAERVAVLAHFAKGSGASPAIHINALGDQVGIGTLSATPAATDDVTALNLALVLKAVVNTHVASTVFHTIADATNVVTSPTPTAGSLNSGDIVRCRTFGPAPDSNDLDDAFVDLANNGPNFAIVVLDMPMTAALAVHVTTGLNTLDAVGKRCLALVRSRMPDFETSETEQAWGTDVEADFDLYEDSRIHVVTEYGLLTDATTSRIYMRNWLGQIAADVIRVDRSVWFDAPDDRLAGAPNLSLVDSFGMTIGHDEGPRGLFTGMSDETQGNRLGCVQRIADQSVVEAVYTTYPWVLFGAGEGIRTVMSRRVANAMKRTVATAMIRVLGSKVFYNPADPNVPGSLPTLQEPTRNALHGAAFDVLTSEFANDIQNPNEGDIDSGLVQVSPYVVVTSGKATVSIYLKVLMFGYLVGINITYAAKE